MNKAYITSSGKFLPGDPVENHELEDYLGMINGEPSRLKDRILKQNGIKQRHYALDKQQVSKYSVAGMAAAAIGDCLRNAGLHKNDIDLLVTATTQGDLPVPGLASMVHAEAELGALEIASITGVCSSSIMALSNAVHQVRSGEKKNAVVCAAEFASRMFKSSRFKRGESLSLDVEFLRWMLSDGAGAMLVQDEVSANTNSLEIEWTDIRSYAHLFDLCMYAGGNKNKTGAVEKYWLDYDTFSEADDAGAIFLKQDARLVNNIIKLGVQRFFELVDEKKIDPMKIDYLLCHYSSHHFRRNVLELMEKGGVVIPEEKWFTNLYTRGNTGAASIFIMLDELMQSGKLKGGETILCMVPESGRFITSFMQLEVHAPVKQRTDKTYLTEINPPEIKANDNEIQQWLVRQLTNTWIDFETRLNKVPIVDKINHGNLTIQEYKELLLNLRQQVIDGSQWIARAASNISMEYFDIRSMFISHSRDEHRDYQMLEKNYIKLGGSMEEIRSGEKNIGSEALSAYMFQRASQPNPFDLLGGMFIIEGLGNRLAGKWGRAIKDQLDLQDEHVSFLIYHESSDADDNHFERFEKSIQHELLTMQIAKRIVKTAKVVAQLYIMQLEELGNY